MTRKKSCHLMDILAEVEDPRKKKGKRHPLNSILALIVVGYMCGHKSYTSIATWARTQPELAKALGFTHKKTPCAATIHNLLKKIDVVALEDVLTKWVTEVLESHPDLKTSFEAVAIDGKVLRASRNSGAGTSHLLSVVSHELGVTLTQRSVSNKTNEIRVSTEILQAFDVSGKVITTDALLAQKSFCQEIINGGGDYMLPVKGNHPGLLDDIRILFQEVPDKVFEDTTHPILGDPLYGYEIVEKSHGRREIRCLKASTSLNEYIDWPGIEQVIEYRYSYKELKTGEETTKVYYGITSLTPEEASAERLLELRRGHWSIENKSHWMRDVVFGEDASPIRCGAGPQVMAALRNTTLSVFRFAGITRIADEIRYLASNPKLAATMIM